MSYAATLKMHMKLESGGAIYVRELAAFPGVLVTDSRADRRSKIERTITFDTINYPTIEKAIEAFNKSQRSNNEQST